MYKSRKRKKETSVFEVMVDLLALLPWWLCLGLAVGSFVYLRSLDAPLTPTAAIRNPGDALTVVQGSVFGLVILVAKFIFPILCLTAAGLSFFARAHRKSLLLDVAQAHNADALNNMSWREFEMLVGEAYRQLGYSVKEMGGNGPDGGVDVVLTKGGEKYLVQCKQWKAVKVGVEIVRELFGLMAATGATGGFVVTSGRFTEPAKDFAKGRNIELVDGPKLFAMIQKARAGVHQATPAPAASALPSTAPSASKPAQPTASTPDCPHCRSSMVMRTARKGANAGGTFWGCVRYPACKGMRASQ